MSQELRVADYIIKPFSVREIIARVNSLLHETRLCDQINENAAEYRKANLNIF